MTDTMTTATIEADPTVPIIRITREFAATPAQLFRAHTEPELFARWIGPDGMDTTVHRWDASTGKEISPAPGNAAPVDRLVFLPGGRELVSVGRDRVVRWDVAGQRAVAHLAPEVQVAGEQQVAHDRFDDAAEGQQDAVLLLQRAGHGVDPVL